MQPYQLRVIDEKEKLDEKLGKLKDFINGEKFKEISDQEQYRMRRQATAMGEYSRVLGERITNFPQEKADG